jgi:hypothetical protein
VYLKIIGVDYSTYINDMKKFVSDGEEWIHKNYIAIQDQGPDTDDYQYRQFMDILVDFS